MSLSCTPKPCSQPTEKLFMVLRTVGMEITPESKFNIEIINNTDTARCFGDTYWIEHFEDGVWKDVDLKNKWFISHDVALGVQPHSSTLMEVNLGIFKDLTPGHYRLLKRVSICRKQVPPRRRPSETPLTPPDEILTAEFEIK